MQKISATIITFNEERNVFRCLASLEGLVDEIIVVDSFSTDRSREICEAAGAKVFERKWEGFATAKNTANALAENDWILSIDADEELSDKLYEEILQAKEQGLSGCYSMNRLTNYCGNWVYHCGWYPDTKIRLFNRRQAKWIGELVHEELSIQQNILVSKFKGDINHYSYHSREDHLRKAYHYSELTAQKFYNKGKRTFWLKPPLSAIVRFLSMYFLKLGVLDGTTGFRICWISARANYHKYKVLNELWKKNE